MDCEMHSNMGLQSTACWADSRLNVSYVESFYNNNINAWHGNMAQNAPSNSVFSTAESSTCKHYALMWMPPCQTHNDNMLPVPTSVHQHYGSRLSLTFQFLIRKMPPFPGQQMCLCYQTDHQTALCTNESDIMGCTIPAYNRIHYWHLICGGM